MTLAIRVLFVSLLCVVQLQAQTGHWEGTIQAADKTAVIEFDLTPNGGTFNLPARNLRALPLANVVLSEKTVTFEIKGDGGGVFQGTLSSDHKSIEGTFSMRGPQSMEIPFTLKRTGDARIEAAPKSAPIGKELEGKWTGTLDVQGVQKQIGLTLASHPDGSSTGSLTSNDGMEIAISAITQKGRDVTLDLKNVGGSYSGTLKDDGTIAGRKAVMGALQLYLDFINIFLFLLRFMGDRR